MNTFDYSVLATKPSFTEAKKDVAVVPAHYKRLVYVFVLIAIILGVQVALLWSESSVYVVLFFASAYLGSALFAYYRYRKEIIAMASVMRFAKNNNLDSFYNAELKTPYPGSLFNDGHTRYVTIGIRTPDKADMIEVGNYKYVTGRGRSARTHNFTYALIKLDKSVPHIFIDSKSNNSWWTRDHASDYANNQKLAFEGDFNTYFDVYVPDEYGRDANYLLTPDVLQALIEYGKDYDFEFMGDTLVMFKRGASDFSEMKTMEVTMSKIGVFANQFRKQTKMYADERVAKNDVGTIAPGGQKLRSAFPWLVTILAIYFLANLIIKLFFSHLVD